MPRATRRKFDKSTALMKAERDAVAALNAWLSAKPGRGAYLSRRTGMQPATITNMKWGETAITAEAAILIELATNRDLSATLLCPSMAVLLRMYRGLVRIPDGDEELPRGLT